MRTFVICLFVAILAYGGYRYWPGRAPVPAATDSPTAAAPAEMPAPPPRRELFTAPRARIEPGKTMKISEACAKFWDGLRGLDMAQKDRKLPPSTACKDLPPQLSKWQSQYEQACANPASQQCEMAIYDYRAALTEEMTKDVPLNTISDPKVLTDKMLARLRADKMDANAVADVADRLFEAQPDMPQAARAAVSMRIQAAAQSAIGKPDDPIWKKVDDALDRSKQSQDPGSRGMLDSKLIADRYRYNDPDKAAQEAENVSRQYPKSAAGPFHEAWAAFDKGDKQAAMEHLRECVRRDAGCAQTMNEVIAGADHPFHPPLQGFNFAP